MAVNFARLLIQFFEAMLMEYSRRKPLNQIISIKRVKSSNKHRSHSDVRFEYSSLEC